MPAVEFRRRAHEQGVSVHDIYQVARSAGARCRRVGRVGSSRGTGYWVWELQRPKDFGIITHAGRRGYYAKIWIAGCQFQNKLGDTKEEARERLAELISAATEGQSDSPTLEKGRGK